MTKSEPPFKLAGLDHVVLLVRNLDHALAFYVYCLGAKVERRVDAIALTQLRVGRSLIDLIALDKPEGGWAREKAAGGGRNMEHLCIEIWPFEDGPLRAHLAAHEVKIVDEGKRYGSQGTGPSFYVLDPDGNTVELKGPPDVPPPKLDLDLTGGAYFLLEKDPRPEDLELHKKVLEQRAAASPRPVVPRPAHTTLSTKRLTLRPVRLGDAEPLFATFSDPETMRYWTEPAHTSLEQTRGFIARNVAAGDTGRSWAITRGSDTPIGLCNLYDRRDQIVGLGYMLAPDGRGHGYATEACQAVLAYAFNDWGIQRIWAQIDPRNTSSAAVLERLGFEREGYMRRDFLYAGQYVDSAYYGLLRENWERKR